LSVTGKKLHVVVYDPCRKFRSLNKSIKQAWSVKILRTVIQVLSS